MLVQSNFKSIQQVDDDIIGDDIAFESLEFVFTSFQLEVAKNQDKIELWTGKHLINYLEAAHALLCNYVFDNDYILG